MTSQAALGSWMNFSARHSPQTKYREGWRGCASRCSGFSAKSEAY